MINIKSKGVIVSGLYLKVHHDQKRPLGRKKCYQDLKKHNYGQKSVTYRKSFRVIERKVPPKIKNEGLSRKVDAIRKFPRS